MKRFITVFSAVLLISTAAVAQTFTRMQSWGLDFEASAWLDAQHGIVVGENLIARTSDGGVTWEEVLQKFEIRFYDVLYQEGGAAVAVGESGTIYVTSDGGKSWQKKESSTQSSLRRLAKLGPTTLFAAGEDGALITSQDSGETWQDVNSGTSLQLNDITFANDSIGFIAADGGTILKSVDKGTSWMASTLTQSNALYGIAFSNELIGYAVGENGIFLKTIDGGTTWATLKSPTTNTLRRVAINPLDIRSVTAVGDLATVVRTANSGTSFSRPNLGSGNTRNLRGIVFNPENNLAATVGQDGYLTTSANGGANWQQKLGGIRNNFTSIDFKNLNSGFVAGENGAFYQTSNGATTLTYRPIPESILIPSINFWNTATGYTGAAEGKIYRTTNGGRNWAPVFTPENRDVSGFYLFSTGILYIAGSQGYIASSFNSGDLWSEPKVTNTTENLKDLMFFDYQIGFAIGEKGHITWSNGGSVWEPQTKLTDEDLNDLVKVDSTRAVVVGNGGIILKTEDKARTWTIVESGTSKNLHSVDFFGLEYGFIAGEEGLALVTSDGGDTWKPINMATMRDLNAVSAGSDQKAYFAGEDGTILTYLCTPPVGGLGDITGDSELCLSSTTYSVPGLPESNSDIVWRVDGGEILSGQGTVEVEVKWTKSGRNAIMVSRSNLCGTGETSALEVNVGFLPPSNVSISGDGVVCQGPPFTYSLPKTEDVTYTWSVSGGTIDKGQGTHEVEITWNENGTKELSVILGNRCGRTQSFLKTVAVNSTAAAPVEISGEARTGLGEQIYSVETLEGLNYRWSISDGGGKVISGQGTGSIVVLWEKEGDFEISVEAQNECGYSPEISLAVNVNIITAIEPSIDPELKIYPNPSQGSLTISSEALDSWTSIEVVTSMGQAIMQLPIYSGQHEAYLQGLPNGLLLLRIQGKDGGVFRKILVQ
jgi:photosystem II stability/assembly factor-like uncharacterized protein